ncbi:MAG: DUF4019 domain-containing protein [Terriglobales bacterium]
MSITPTPEPVPNVPSTPPRSKRVIWKWSLALTAVVLIFLMWQCGSGLLRGRSLSAQAVHHFHEQFNNNQYTEIWTEADEGFQGSEQEQEWVNLLAAVHRKLGNAGVESLTNINVNATTNGTFITAIYKTPFDRGQAIETFTWKKDARGVRLYGYNVQSNALVLN